MPAQDKLDDAVEVVVGYLVTFPDGYETRLPIDSTRDRAYAEKYAVANHARCEAMYVRRPRPVQQWPKPSAP